MNRLTVLLRVLDSYATYNIHRRILCQVIAAKQALKLDSSADEQDLWWFLSRWSLTFVFDRRDFNHFLQIAHRPDLGFVVKRHCPAGRIDWLGDYARLEQAFDCFMTCLRKELCEPYRINWHWYTPDQFEQQIVGIPDPIQAAIELDRQPFDDPYSRLLRHDCVVYDWSDQRHSHYVDS